MRECCFFVVKDELCEVVKVERVSEIVMAVVLVSTEDVRLICGHVPQSGRSLGGK